MKNYIVTIYDDFFDQEFSGEFSADTKKQAIKEAKIFYAIENDTSTKDIKIVKVEKKEQINITVFNDGEKVFTGSAADFLKDNTDDEDVNEMLTDAILTGKSKRDFYHSGIWQVIKNNI